MAYIDEEILAKREEAKKEKYTTIEDGIYLDGRILTFTRKTLSGALSICLPDVMEQMPEDYARIKYPSEFRPGIIMTTGDLSVNMGFTVFPAETLDGDRKTVMEHIRAVLHRSNPDCRMYPCEDLKETEGSYFTFRSHAMDSDLYNMLLLASVGDKLLQSNFNCYYKDHMKWKKIVQMIWETIWEAEEE